MESSPTPTSFHPFTVHTSIGTHQGAGMHLHLDSQVSASPMHWGALAVCLRWMLCAFSLACSLPTLANAQDLSGRWRGTWTSSANARHAEHRGPLRAKFVSNGDGSYRALFAGRFFGIIPFAYRAQVTQNGDRVVSTRRLGPLGEYRMQLVSSPGGLYGGWNAAGENGTIGLRRR